MKKLVLMFVAIAAISFASCGNKTAATDATADTTDTTAQGDTDTVPAQQVDTPTVNVNK